VGATRYDETRASYSNCGDAFDLTAPGGDLDVDQNGDGYGDGVLQNTFNPNTKNTSDFGYWFFDGTSMAAPHVSGVAALLILYGVDTTPDQVRNRLQSTAENLGAAGWDSTYGWGLVDAYAALDYGGNKPPVASFSYTTEGLTCNFDASASHDPDGTIVRYDWLFGDGNSWLGVTPSHTYAGVGTYTVVLTVTDDDGATDTDTQSVTVSEPGATMHVGDLDGSKSVKGKSGNWQVLVTVTIHDQNCNPVADATVFGSWSGAKSGDVSGTTGADGTVSFNTGSMNGGSSVTFTVTDVTHTTLTYNALVNHDPDGDSNGTIITVSK
jgi:serine protease